LATQLSDEADLFMNNNSNNGQKSGSRNLVCVTKDSPCPHCGKTDWCYSIGELSVCNRDEAPAAGWEATTKSDADGHFFYAPARPKKPIRPAQTRYWEYPSRDGEKLVRVRRIDFGNGKKKDIKQQHWDETLNKWETNLKGISRASIPIYRYPEIQKAIADNQLIFIVDGEQCADYLWDLGLAATTSIGGMGKWRITDTSDLQGAKVVISPDRDDPGLKDAVKVSEHFPDAQWLYSDPGSWEWDNPPDSDGLDVMDWIKDKGLNAQDILNSLTSRPRTQENVVSLSSSSSGSYYIPDTAPSGEQSFIHKAIDALYSDRRWASVAGQLLEYTGTHYEVRSEGSEKRRIYAWLKTYAEFVKGKYRCNRYNSASTNDVYNCIVGSVDVDIKDINPPGLNCSNGVLRINPDGSHTLHPHNPDQIYTYVGGKYDPDIDPRDCDRLLECLEPAQREIFLRTVAASLCLPLVRLKMSRVKGLLNHGGGNNGKDALRAALVAVLGRGVTNKTLKDFQVYDTGRKFPLAGLEGSLCNWSSENSDSAKLDKIQSLKQFITGDELTIEHKGKGEYPYKPEAIFLANCNLLPSISSDAEAIKSRYSILSFKKTYVVGAVASKGEMEADPRFKEDPNFVLEKIAPALLNRMLERLPLVLKEGIDYNSTNTALRAAQEKSNHLWQFMRDRGYEAGKGERVYAKDAWSDLQDWYIETGTLELEYDRDGKEKRVWNELPGRDTPVKAINQLFARLSELVPNLEKHRHTERGFESERTMGDFYYLGLMKHTSEKSDKSAPASPAVDTASILPPAVLQQNVSAGALLEQTTLIQSGAGAAGALSSPFSELCNLFSQLSEDERQRMVDSLTGVPCSDPLKAFRVGDKVAGNKPEDSSYNWHGRIVEITTSISCRVDWQEREGMRGGRVISMLFCNLRKI
jgi:phage/plasmid-associated DNA primase